MTNTQIREEILSIKDKYENITDDSVGKKIEMIKKLDRSVEESSSVFALTFGILGAIVFSLGIIVWLCFEKLSASLVISILGILIMAMVLPLKKVISACRKEEVREKIISFSTEVLNSLEN